MGDLEHQLLELYRQFFTRFFSCSLVSSVFNGQETNECQSQIVMYDEAHDKQYSKSQMDQSKMRKSSSEQKPIQGYRGNVPEAGALEASSFIIQEKLGYGIKVSEAGSMVELSSTQNRMHSKVVLSHVLSICINSYTNK